MPATNTMSKTFDTPIFIVTEHQLRPPNGLNSKVSLQPLDTKSELLKDKAKMSTWVGVLTSPR